MAEELERLGTEVALAEDGEVICRGPHVFEGYLNDPDKTAETFVTIDGTLWAVSGDAGRLDPDGMITVFGRGSTCINTGGEKVFPEEVEEVLRTHPAIFDAVVAGRPDPRWGERETWAALARAGRSPTDFYLLAALDLRRDADDAITGAPQEQAVFRNVLGRTLWISAMVKFCSWCILPWTAPVSRWVQVPSSSRCAS